MNGIMSAGGNRRTAEKYDEEKLLLYLIDVSQVDQVKELKRRFETDR